MDGVVLATLFLTGFCALSSSFPNVLYFIEEEMTWHDASKYCDSEYIRIAQIQNMEDATATSKASTWGYTDKAWIGLMAYDTEWTWDNGERCKISQRIKDQQYLDQFCVATNKDETWTSANCSDKKPFVCQDGEQYYLNQSRSTWNEAITSCEDNGDVLAIIKNASTNVEVSLLLGNEMAWIGLYRRKLWYWPKSGEKNEFANWQNGQPDDLHGLDNCAAVVLTDGTWTDEPCAAKYPFFCSGVYEVLKTVVRMKIHSSKNMEDPAHSADLLQQLRAALAQQGLTDFQLTWKKLPEKIQVNESSASCLMTL